MTPRIHRRVREVPRLSLHECKIGRDNDPEHQARILAHQQRIQRELPTHAEGQEPLICVLAREDRLRVAAYLEQWGGVASNGSIRRDLGWDALRFARVARYRKWFVTDYACLHLTEEGRAAIRERSNMLSNEQREIIAQACADGRYSDNTMRRGILTALAAAGGVLSLPELSIHTGYAEIYVRSFCHDWLLVVPTRVGPEQKHGYRLSVLLLEKLGFEPLAGGCEPASEKNASGKNASDRFADIRPWLARAKNIATVAEGLDYDPRAAYVLEPGAAPVRG